MEQTQLTIVNEPLRTNIVNDNIATTSIATGNQTMPPNPSASQTQAMQIASVRPVSLAQAIEEISVRLVSGTQAADVASVKQVSIEEINHSFCQQKWVCTDEKGLSSNDLIIRHIQWFKSNMMYNESDIDFKLGYYE
jgi:hypothetical protein